MYTWLQAIMFTLHFCFIYLHCPVFPFFFKTGHIFHRLFGVMSVLCIHVFLCVQPRCTGDYIQILCLLQFSSRSMHSSTFVYLLVGPWQVFSMCSPLCCIVVWCLWPGPYQCASYFYPTQQPHRYSHHNTLTW